MRVLAGGLGLGIILRALLDEPAIGFVQVVELFPDLVQWNRLHLDFLHGGALADPRVAVEAGDLLAFLAREPCARSAFADRGPAASSTLADRGPAAFDLILLDIDNGPTMLALPANEGLYAPEGLAQLRAWLAPRGVAVFWATESAPDFERALDAQAAAQWWRETIGWLPARGGRELADVLYFLTNGERFPASCEQ